MTNAARVAGAVLLAVAVCAGPGGPGAVLGPRAAQAAEDWKKEFEDVCAKTQDAMAIPTEELKALVVRCDALKPTIEALDESTRKVYLRRLKTCRDLYQYVIEYREQGQG